MANNGRIDESVMVPGIPSGVQGVELLLNGYNDGTTEVRNLLKYECDVIVECKICRNLFRSLPSFVSHKRIYCKESAFEQVSNALVDAEEVANIVSARPASTESCPNFTTDNSTNDNDPATATATATATAAAAAAAENGGEKKPVVLKQSPFNNVRSEAVRNASKLTLNFLNRLVKRIETASANPATFVPLHRYPEVHRIVPQIQLQNGLQSIKNPAELDKLPVKERKNDESTVIMVLPQDAAHRQHAMELRTRRNFTADMVKQLDPDEIKLYDRLSESGTFDLSNLTCMVENCQKTFKTVSLAVYHLENGHKAGNSFESTLISPSTDEMEFSLPSDYLADVHCSDEPTDNNCPPVLKAEIELGQTDSRKPVLNSREKRNRTVKSPYDLDFITSWPKRLKRSPTETTPVKSVKRHRPSAAGLSKFCKSKENTPVFSGVRFPGQNSASNLDKFPIVFTLKQKEQTLAVMDEKEKRCRQCGALFTSKANLERHCYLHLGFIRFRCTKCEFGAFYRTELRRHLRMSCPGRDERMKSAKIDDDFLNSLIVPACPEEPGKVIASINAKSAGLARTSNGGDFFNKAVPKKLNGQKRIKQSTSTAVSSNNSSFVDDSPKSNDQQSLLSVKPKATKSPPSEEKKDKSVTPKKSTASASSPSVEKGEQDDRKLIEIKRENEKRRQELKKFRGSFKRICMISSKDKKMKKRSSIKLNNDVEIDSSTDESNESGGDGGGDNDDDDDNEDDEEKTSLTKPDLNKSVEEQVVGNTKKGSDSSPTSAARKGNAINIKRTSFQITKTKSAPISANSAVHVTKVGANGKVVTDDKADVEKLRVQPRQTTTTTTTTIPLTITTKAVVLAKGEQAKMQRLCVPFVIRRNPNDPAIQKVAVIETNASSTPPGTIPLLKPSIKMFKGEDGKVMAKAFVPKV